VLEPAATESKRTRSPKQRHNKTSRDVPVSFFATSRLFPRTRLKSCLEQSLGAAHKQKDHVTHERRRNDAEELSLQLDRLRKLISFSSTSQPKTKRVQLADDDDELDLLADDLAGAMDRLCLNQCVDFCCGHSLPICADSCFPSERARLSTTSPTPSHSTIETVRFYTISTLYVPFFDAEGTYQIQKFVSMATELYPSDRQLPISSLGSKLRVVSVDSVQELLNDLPTPQQLTYVEHGFFSTISPLHHAIRYSLWRKFATEVYAARDSGVSPKPERVACVLIICGLGILGPDGKDHDKLAAAVGFPESRDLREEVAKKWLASAMQALLLGERSRLASLKETVTHSLCKADFLNTPTVDGVRALCLFNMYVGPLLCESSWALLTRVFLSSQVHYICIRRRVIR
jgi:hypothetical protein